MKKIIRLTESDLSKIVRTLISEQSFHKRMNMDYNDIEFWINSLRDTYYKSKFNFDNEYFGLDSGSIKRFLRRMHNFEYFLATQILESIEDGKEGFYLSSGKNKFVTNILIGSLILYFSETEGKELDGEDFMRNGSEEGWLDLVKKIYGDYLEEVYETLF